jgi:lysophospholipase L1-like esterase
MLQAKGSATKVINAGISGDTSAGILSRIGSAVPEGTRIVILSVFAYNDNRKGISSGKRRRDREATAFARNKDHQRERTYTIRVKGWHGSR